MKHIVLIHGAGHGAWCWERLVPLLEGKGYEVDAPDLPGLGDDPTPLENVTFQAYVDCVVSRITAKTGAVLLLGHSMGGAPISRAAEAAPEAVAKLVYLAALLPQDGESISSMIDSIPVSDEPSARGCMRSTQDGRALEFVAELARKTFYNKCASDIAERAVRRLRPQASAPLATPLRLTRTRWGAIPKTYVICARDRAMPPSAQNWFAKRCPAVKQLVIDTDHSPFYSDPQALADIIHSEAF